MAQERLYKFSWDFIGDIEAGRPNLGNTTRIEVYRLFQYTLRDVLEEEFGAEKADRLLWKAGFLAGENFCRKFVLPQPDINSFVAKVQQTLADLKVGIMRVEGGTSDGSMLTISVSEDLDCSGLPDMNHVVCTYDEGFISGVFYAYTGKKFDVKEIDCWCTGDRTCRFEVTRKD
ncbi:MAG: 4-vinyl reductase [Deltaproteobacteria bacterium]|jgi:predicted hydrocarbon binding protein|nr:4-vinyl reductase [Deltaproteobacteria bacterium]